MKTSLSIVYLFLILLFASCEDKESSSKNKSETTSENNVSGTKASKLDSLKAKYAKKEEIALQNEEEVDDRFPIPQEQLIPFLTQYGKESIPLYVYYPAGQNTPVFLPELLTPDIVLDYLNQ